jgi:hypothetical protein
LSHSVEFLSGLAVQTPELATNMARPLQIHQFGRHSCCALCIRSQIPNALFATAAKPQFENNPSLRTDFRIDAPLPAKCLPI